MGYRLGAFVSRGPFDVERLRELPQEIGYAAYREAGGSLLVVDTFPRSKKPQYPFSGAFVSGSSLEVADATLAALYEFLRGAFMSNSFPRKLMNAVEAMSGLAGVPILGFETNDDDLDFTCIATGGKVDRIVAVCGTAIRATWSGGRLTVERLVPEDALEEGEGGEDEIDLEALARAVPGVTISSDPIVSSFRLHDHAAGEFEAFTQRPRSLLGLDGEPLDPAAFEIVAQR